MHFDIRTAALDSLTEQRLQLAASLLGAWRMRAQISPWDGTRCHLLVADTDDAYGRRAMALAARRGTGVLALGQPRDDLPVTPTGPLKTALEFARALRERLEIPAPGTGAAASPGKATPAVLPLCSLALPPRRGTALILRCHGSVVHLRPEIGRAYAATVSDMLAVANGMCEADCSIESSGHGTSMQDLVSRSLEAFLLRAAFHAGDRLPPFPSGSYHLDTWPDLGTLSTPIVSALRIARAMTTRPVAANDLAAAGLQDIDPAEFNAALWAFAASDLLRGANAAPLPPAPERPARIGTALWSNIARRFGLLRA